MTPLVILPGLMCDGRMFAGQLAAFPGSMAIGGFYGDAASITDMAQHALARMPERAVVLGHSMGARVAIELVRLAPERVAGLVIADTGIHPVKPGEKEARHGLLDLGRREGIPALVDAWLPPMVAEANRQPGLMDELSGMCLDAGVDTYEREIGALLSRPDAEAVLPHVTCPVLVVVGEDDTWSPIAQHEAIVALLPRAELSVVPGAGHMMPAEAPDALNAVLGDWLEREGLLG